MEKFFKAASQEAVLLYNKETKIGVKIPFGTVACARHRQVRLASLAAAKHTPRKGQPEQHGKTKSTGFPKKICDAKIFWEEET